MKVKSFSEMVRLQRPAVTRKWQDVTKQRQQSSAAAAARQAGVTLPGQKTWTVQDPNLVNGKPKEYGKLLKMSKQHCMALCLPQDHSRDSRHVE